AKLIAGIKACPIDSSTAEAPPARQECRRRRGRVKLRKINGRRHPQRLIDPWYKPAVSIDWRVGSRRSPPDISPGDATRRSGPLEISHVRTECTGRPRSL